MAHFIDTNVAIYAFQPGPKSERALAVLGGAHLNVQVLNEFANVGLRKLGFDEHELHGAITDLRSKALTIAAVTEEVHDLARRITFRYQLSFYDAALLAAAILAGCRTFYSEDMQDGLVIEGALTVRNPFA